MEKTKKIFKNLKLLLVISFITIVACSKDTETPNVNVQFEETTINAGEALKFSISNNPDLVTLYSGEFGFKYEHRERLAVEASIPELSFHTYNKGKGDFNEAFVSYFIVQIMMA
ncbi:DUF5017 domain-containing protein [Tamlana sp. 2201CG12-4]|uniref:DUF5017 domain-containing protein n=1 Tax=Tamlana sp. 2201CG12-4 TaxID=3112582 RepID=UPI002DBE9C71|nr:DUF5017 domain-containing protein [Tamlana sp. 2201CG12-4]MEC3908814.1 DUF5017 domain-containing protein [Tamlana sp. 2201CG12-4]